MSVQLQSKSSTTYLFNINYILYLVFLKTHTTDDTFIILHTS